MIPETDCWTFSRACLSAPWSLRMPSITPLVISAWPASRDVPWASRFFSCSWRCPSWIWKVALMRTAFSWVLNPRKGGIFQTIYFFSYSPILVLGLLGVLETRHRWKEFGLIYMLFISFLLVVAVFFAHTSHRTHLDIFLIIFSAHSIRTMHARRARWLHRVRLLFQRRSANMC